MYPPELFDKSQPAPAVARTPAEQFRHFVPVDKNLPPTLTRDLLERGRARVYRGKDLASIAMPVGGITTGKVYLRGDGALLLDPALSPGVNQAFAVVAEVNGNPVVKHLNGEAFSNVEFVGEYPIGKVHYAEEGFPLTVGMEAFAPFIPLNTRQSALPGTYLHITVENTGTEPLRAGVLGKLESGGKGRVVNEKNRAMIVYGGNGQSGATTDALVLALDGQVAPPQTVGELLPPAKKNTDVLASQSVELAAGEKKTFAFVLTWFFPSCSEGNEYANRFAGASEVAHHLLDRHERLAGATRAWHRTFYEDSTLPRWLLVRLHSTASSLATATCQWRKNGRFWGWEGERSHAGTCIHVWHYAHAVARLFPELERSAREMQDFAPGIFNTETGLVSMRGEHYATRHYAADGQCGTVLRAYREHQMSTDRAFLERNWPHIKKALEFSINHDANKEMRVWRDSLGGFPVEYSAKEDGKPDGLIEGIQPQTWDGYFHGPNTMVGSLYLAALRAGEEMAREMGDEAFADRCHEIFESGSRLTVERLWDGEYFIQLVDLKAHPRGQYGKGCNSDQVFGQGWAHHVGLGYIYPPRYVKQALQSVWKYNWAPDVGPQHAAHPPYRAFANPGEAGLFTCTWPKSENMDKLSILGGPPGEVFTGIEYQVAGNMVWEGLLTEALAICHGIDERYQPPKRNPFNEVEAGDHYSRAMASWGVFTALAGYEYHGPKGYLGFAPRVTPEHFQSAFTAAEGWGSFTQKREGDTQRNRIEVRWGKVRLKRLALEVPEETASSKVTVTAAGKALKHAFTLDNGHLEITLADPVTLREGQAIDVTVNPISEQVSRTRENPSANAEASSDSPTVPITLGATSGKAVSLCIPGEIPDLKRVVDRWKTFFAARKIPVKVVDSSADSSLPEGPVIAFETKEQAPLARAVGIKLDELKTGSPEAYLMISREKQGHPLVLIVGETSKGTDCGAAWLQSKVACLQDGGSKDWSITVAPLHELRRPFFRGREATLCPTGRILRGNPEKARKINFELWSEEQLKQYPGFLKACGFNSVQVMELLAYRGGARREQVAPVIHTLADAAHGEGMEVSQYIWGSADGFHWTNPKTRKQREQRYIGLAETYGKYVDHIVTHWKDEGYEGGYIVPQEATAFLLEQYKQHNPDIRATQDAWFNHDFWSGWKGSKSQTFLDEAYTPKTVGIALQRWYDAEKASLVEAAGRPVGIWGWYMGDFEMDYSSHILTRTIHKYYHALPSEASGMVDWISIELCFHTLPSQVNLYVGGQMMCDPQRSLEEIMFDYCQSVYGVENAQTMTEVYKVVEMGQKEYRYGMVQGDRYPRVHGTPEFTEEAKRVLAKLKQVELPAGWKPNFPTVSDPGDDIKSLRASLDAYVRDAYPTF